MKFLKSFLQSMSGKKALTIFSIIIVAHLSIMFVYFQNIEVAQQTANRDELIQKIINVIYLMEATPKENRAHAVSAMEDPDLQVSITTSPTAKLRFERVSFWLISRALENNLGSFAISIRFARDQWLNLNGTVYTHVLMTQLILIALEILVFGTILIAAWSISRFTRPLNHFKLMAERLGIDLDAKPVAIYGPSVVREAAQAMNKMQQRIQDLIRDRTQMLAAISHDLRTPITRMKLRAQFVEDLTLYQNFIYDLDEMEKMINETLSFAREDSAKEDKVSIDLISLLDTVCEETRELGGDVNFNSNVHRVAFVGRPLALKRAFTNLVNNGVRYGGHVDVSVHLKNHLITILIEDEGPGLPEADLTQVFAPFYRAENSRSRDTGGVGLGLAVTRDIIRSHYGKIELKNRRKKGLRVIVELKGRPC